MQHVLDKPATLRISNSPSLGRARPLGITRSMPLCTKGSTRGGAAPEAAAEATSQPTPFLHTVAMVP